MNTSTVRGAKGETFLWGKVRNQDNTERFGCEK